MTCELQELQQKLMMAAEEVECVRADYEEQLQQTRQMAESAKEESEEQHCKVHNLKRELGVAQNAKNWSKN